MTESPDRTGSARRHRRALLVLVTAVLALSGFGGWWLVERHQVAVGAASAQEAAERYVQTMTNFDTTGDPAVLAAADDALLDGATGSFREGFLRSHEQLRAFRSERRASVHGAVVDSAIESATAGTVVVDLTVEETVRNRDLPAPDIDDTTLRLTMTRADGRWLVSQMESV